MNKTEKFICLVLGAVLAWYVFSNMKKAASKTPASDTSAAVTNVAAVKAAAKAAAAADTAAAVEPAAALPSVPERTAVLESDEVKVEVSTYGAVVKRVTLKDYAQNRGAVSADNPSVTLDFADSPLGAGATLEAFELTQADATSATFRAGERERVITLKAGYLIELRDRGISGPLSLGVMRMGDSKNDLISVDSWSLAAANGKGGVVHHGDDDSPLKPYLAGSLGGGCSSSKSAAGMPAKVTVGYPGAQRYVALKNRFFVTALAEASEPNAGFTATVTRDVRAEHYRPERVAATVDFAGTGATRTATFFVGPKRQALLWQLGMKDVMEFGMWRWVCYPLVWVLNLFHSWVPNYGIAIILLTILVRLVFWPLTRKSTEGMKKMQEIQPLMKELQQKYKDNPQRLQQETWQLYREKKVNPLSSCLPMLIQIPVFIALFNVLRSAVELRYAPFLWIGDLSEPEGLLAAYFPFGGLNLLPVLMAVTTGLQSYFTPSGGDKNQQKMMMVMMPAMMLVMFYSFPSALSLYWFLSNLFSIVQMWLIRRQTAAAAPAAVAAADQPPATRQMRRHG